VFTGKPTGEFVALDEQTGRTLWQFKTGSSVNSTAITYTYKGRQFVTVASVEHSRSMGGRSRFRHGCDGVWQQTWR
jgi:outer membrane protein assembly factor BamB